MKTLILILLTISASAQEYNNWVFSRNNHIRFPGPTNQPASQITTVEGCASISDNTGQLLMYSDGVRVWNRNHVQMSNGFGLQGGVSSSQSVIITAQPGNANFYYIFTVQQQGSGGLHSYSIVNMALNSGLGDVIVKNVLIASNTCELMTMCMSNNNIDKWIITHEVNNNRFRAVRLTAFGITSNITSNTGANVNGEIGCLRSSPLRDRIAMANYEQNRFYIYNFNNTTGVVTNQVLLSSQSGPYSCEFSPNGKLLYLSFNANNRIEQFDVCTNTLSHTIIPGIGNLIGTMQATPDGRIFIAQKFSLALHCIRFPNVLGAGCLFTPNFYATTSMLEFGLPNNIQPCPLPILLPFAYNLNCNNLIATLPTLDCILTVQNIEWLVNGVVISNASILNTTIVGNNTVTLRFKTQCLDYVYTYNLNGNVNNVIGNINSN
jgi:hypothetical protein